ncbi:hypothetical protein TARUN_6241 [Trichoderma arundinaceum]|uniref:Uncharacterized protein n=1 Tax=Trichoderma arundinaceum TaxID=490622 RepID=A0A395NJG2_TRIAR|nr:hypothetical protein TARUN_6241 [Trichoderma arundinaceum]
MDSASFLHVTVPGPITASSRVRLVKWFPLTGSTTSVRPLKWRVASAAKIGGLGEQTSDGLLASGSSRNANKHRLRPTAAERPGGIREMEKGTAIVDQNPRLPALALPLQPRLLEAREMLTSTAKRRLFAHALSASPPQERKRHAYKPSHQRAACRLAATAALRDIHQHATAALSKGSLQRQADGKAEAAEGEREKSKAPVRLNNRFSAQKSPARDSCRQ